MTVTAPIRALLLDLDGVLWRGHTLLPGVSELFALLEERRLPFCLASNNATLSLEEVQARLAPAGVTIRDGQLITSAQAAAGFIRRTYRQPPSVYVIGEDGLRRALVEAGCSLLERADRAAAVVVGMDRNLSWEKLVEAGLAIAAGAAFVGTNPDRTFPTERGLGPGNGAVLAALETATGRSPVIVGKPEPHLFLEATARLAQPPGQVLVVGDRLETDIEGGRRAGMQTALILTGATQPADLRGGEIRPDAAFEDLPAFTTALPGWLG
jgi:4-nitrophenyl phosphatase